MTPVLTADANPVLLEWSTQTSNTASVSHVTTANVAPVALGGMWSEHKIDAEDIQQARKELWGKLEAAE
jgi:hypothetical protein